MIERVRLIQRVPNSSAPLKFLALLSDAGFMKKDLSKNDERIGSMNSVSSPILLKKRISRAFWSESSKAIARDGDDYLRLGELPNLEDQELEW
jgi:antitoxin MazE